MHGDVRQSDPKTLGALNCVPKLTAIALATGLPAAFVIAKLFNSIRYGIKPNDAITFISIPLFLAFVALLASYIPARRATKLDPMIVLRYE